MEFMWGFCGGSVGVLWGVAWRSREGSVAGVPWGFCGGFREISVEFPRDVGGVLVALSFSVWFPWGSLP